MIRQVSMRQLFQILERHEPDCLLAQLVRQHLAVRLSKLVPKRRHSVLRPDFGLGLLHLPSKSQVTCGHGDMPHHVIVQDLLVQPTQHKHLHKHHQHAATAPRSSGSKEWSGPPAVSPPRASWPLQASSTTHSPSPGLQQAPTYSTVPGLRTGQLRWSDSRPRSPRLRVVFEQPHPAPQPRIRRQQMIQADLAPLVCSSPPPRLCPH